jgi:MFS family permease
MLAMKLESLSPAEKPKTLRHNFTVNVLDGTLWIFGITFVSSSTILPVYLSHLTANAIIIGMLPALELLGWAFPQIFTAPLFEGRSRMKPFVLTSGLIQRIPYLLIAILIWWAGSLPAEANDTVLFWFLFLYTVYAFCGGITAIPWQEMISRLFPLRQRGRFYAAQRFFGGIFGLAGAFAAGWLLLNVAYPYNFALCFVCAFVLMMGSWFVLAQTREPALPSARKTSRSARAYARELWTLLRADRAFVWYLIARALGYLGWMATAFFAVYAVRAFQLADAQAAVFGALLLVSSIGANVLWGWMGDKHSQKLVLILSSAAYAFALLLAAVAANVYFYYAVFFLMGVASTGLMVSDLTLVVEFAPEARRPTYMGLARGIWGPFIGLSPLLGGFLWATYGYPVLIWVSLFLTVVGTALVLRRVREPRARQNAGSQVAAVNELGK